MMGIEGPALRILGCIIDFWARRVSRQQCRWRQSLADYVANEGNAKVLEEIMLSDKHTGPWRFRSPGWQKNICLSYI